MSVELPDRDGDGYLLSMDDWSPEVAHAMAAADGIELTEEKWQQIMQAREYYDETQSVPPIRIFLKHIGARKKDVFDLWLTGPMKPITKYGGLPKPRGCV